MHPFRSTECDDGGAMSWPNVFEELLSSDFMPHGHCYLWRPSLVALHAVSDGMVALAYTSIPFTLFVFARRRRDIPFNWMFLCFAMFIIACGATRYLEVWTLWHGTYWLSGVVKAVTALASVPTAILLMRLVPRLLAIPGPDELARATAAQRESDARFRAALHGSRDAFLLVRAVREGESVVDFTVVDCNERGARLLGAARGQRISEALADDDARAVLARWSAARRAGVSREEVGFRAQPGATFEEQLVPVEDGFAVAIHDVSERARAENLRARLAAIVESSDDAIFSLGLGGLIETWNAGAERLFGWTRDEIIGQPATLLEIDVHAARAEAVRRRKDDSSVDVALVVSPIHDAGGAITGHAVIARDVSAQKRAERQVQASLREKDVLLTEVHHRVKNNLQVICSLLSLQAAKVEDGARAGDVPGEPGSGALHRGLPRAPLPVAGPGAHRHRRLRADPGHQPHRHLRRRPPGARGGRRRRRAPRRGQGDPLRPAGQRAGVERPQARLPRRARRPGARRAAPRRALRAQRFVLTVEDDGVGLPATLEVGRAATLGHQLVITLARQLGGSVSLDRTRGARFTITFSRGNVTGPVDTQRETRDGVDPHR